MIITIRGASGAGKSTLVRRLTETLPAPLHVFRNDRSKKPQYSIYPLGNVHKLVVLGHYFIANGGIDTLGTLTEAYGLAVRHANEGAHVLMEGMCMSDSAQSAINLFKNDVDVRVLVLTTPLEECVASVRERGHNIARRSIERIHDRVQKHAYRFEQIGITTFCGNRDECLKQAQTWLGING